MTAITKSDIETLIEIEKKDNIFTHLLIFITRDVRAYGKVEKKHISVWHQNLWLTMFYPIFKFEFNEKNHLIKVSDRLNPLGKIFIGLAICGILYLFIPENIDLNNFTVDWFYVTIFWSFFLIVGFVAKKIYSSDRKNKLQEIFDFLDIEYQKPKPENEWSLKNILIRIFTYPFSIFIIVICILGLFEYESILMITKSILMTIIGVGICGTYLVTDIKMIISNKKNTFNKNYKNKKPVSIDK